MKEIQQYLYQKLLITSPEVSLFLEQFIEESLDVIEPIVRNRTQFWKVEKYFDKAVVAKLKNGNGILQVNLRKNLEKRIAKQFLMPAASKFIQQSFQSCQSNFIQNLIAQDDFLPNSANNVLDSFQKEWDKQLVQFLQIGNQLEKESATDYYFNYFQSKTSVQHKEFQVKQKYPNNNLGNYSIPFQEAFTRFIKKIEEKGFAFKANSDAYFTIIFDSALIDFGRKQMTLKIKHEPSKPTNLDLTNPTEAHYIAIEVELKPIQMPYSPYLGTALKMLGEKCKKVLKLYFFAKQNIAEIAEDEAITKQSIHARLHKCIATLKGHLEKIKQVNG